MLVKQATWAALLFAVSDTMAQTFTLCDPTKKSAHIRTNLKIFTDIFKPALTIPLFLPAHTPTTLSLTVLTTPSGTPLLET